MPGFAPPQHEDHRNKIIEKLWDVLGWIENMDPQMITWAERKFEFDLVERKFDDV